MKTIKVKEVQRAIDLLFNHITKEQGVEELPLSQDYYWNIPLEQTYRMEAAAEKVAESLDVGSLAEDLGTVERVISQPESRVAFQLAQIAPLLRYLGKAAEEERLKKGR